MGGGPLRLLWLLLWVGAVRPGLREDVLERCFSVGEAQPGQPPLTFEWRLNATAFTGRFSSSAVRTGATYTADFVGIALKGDGFQQPTGSENLMLGWPTSDGPCISTLYMNTSSTWRGKCVQTNVTTCSGTGLNYTCNVSLAVNCSCTCTAQAGCWGPAPSCATCTDGCNQCAAGYAGSTCRVPIVTDVYEPDADNGVIRLTFLRDLVTYGNPYQAGVPAAIDLLWAYRHASLFDPTYPRCADGVLPNLGQASPYAMVNSDTERVTMAVDLTSAAYNRLADGSCVSVPFAPTSPSARPIRHVRLEQGAPALGSGWVTRLLKLGAYDDRIQVGAGSSIDATTLTSEATGLTPEPSDAVRLAGGTQQPLVWSVLSAAGGQWGQTSTNAWVTHYLALAVYTAVDFQTSLVVRPNDAAVVWLDGVVVFSASAAVDADVDSGTLGVAAGWHQLVVKFRKAPTGTRYFRARFSTVGLSWKPSQQSTLDVADAGTGWLATFLHLGASATDGVVLASSAGFSAARFPVTNESALQPQDGDVQATPWGTSPAMAWQPLYRKDGTWAFGSYNNFVEYFSLALYAAVPTSTNITYRNDEAVRGWLDGQLVIASDVWDNNRDQAVGPIQLAKGWHQILFKLQDQTGGSRLKFKFSAGAQLRWSYSMPLQCVPNPCLRGGVCQYGECQCPVGFSGQYCEAGFLWGEKFQNRRVAILYLQ
eukprot:EG_transcript_3502